MASSRRNSCVSSTTSTARRSQPNPALAQAIEALPGRKLVLTNGSHAHALATSKQLGIDHLFEDFFAIEQADYLPKPALSTYQRFFERHAVDPARAAMFEDMVHNLEAPHASGMLTVLVRPKPGALDHREDWEKTSGRAARMSISSPTI